MKRRGHNAALYLALALISFVPLSARGEASIISPINHSCGDWVAERSNKSSYYLESWALGFMSGMAFRRAGDLLAGTTADSILVWIDNYCAAHPSDELTISFVKLEQELRRRQGPN